MDRPILFFAPMVRALLESRKTQTRRILTPNNLRIWTGGLEYSGRYVKPVKALFDAALNNARDFRLNDNLLSWVTDPATHQVGAIMAQWLGKLRYEVGDRLWVKETWSHTGDCVWSISDARFAGNSNGHPIYRADYTDKQFPSIKMFPSIFMPREFSRLTLEVTGVKVERLQDISQVDALDEGISLIDLPTLGPPEMAGKPPLGQSPYARYKHLWEAINGNGSWAMNPFVVAISFKVHKCNIDAIPSPKQKHELETV